MMVVIKKEEEEGGNVLLRCPLIGSKSKVLWEMVQ
jgi:hypothetical protein